MPKGIYQRDPKKRKPTQGFQKNSGMNKGRKNPSWRGGRRKHNGYIEIHCPNHPNSNRERYVLEHRLVVEQFIERYLKPNEIIHHIDEDKTNNDIDNLMIFKSTTEHLKFHAKIRQFGMTNPIQRQIKERWNEF